ncbi:MAG: hypothetical protein ACI8UG_001871 [Gammaproteobacteria bacterium]|jgi:hypothetical protein
MLTVQTTQFVFHKTDVKAGSVDSIQAFFITEYEQGLYVIFNKPKFT